MQTALAPTTQAEQVLFKGAQVGQPVVDVSDPANRNCRDAKKWDKDRSIRGSFLSHLCRARLVPLQSGIQVRGARITEQFDVSFLSLVSALSFVESSFDEQPLLNATQVPFLVLKDCCSPGLGASFAKIGESLAIIGIHSTGTIHLNGARVGGQLVVSGKLYAPALSRTGDGADAVGPTSLRTVALSAENTRVGFSCRLDGVHARGRILLGSAEIGGSLSCPNARLRGSRDENGGLQALNADGIRVQQSVQFRGVVARGQVSFRTAQIQGQFECTESRLRNPGSTALALGDSVVGRSASLAGTRVTGEVNWGHAQVGSQVLLDDTKLRNPRRCALLLDGTRLTGSLHLGHEKGADFSGSVSMIRTVVEGQLTSQVATFRDPAPSRSPGSDNVAHDSVVADGIQVTGELALRDVEADGRICFPGAHIGGQFCCRDVSIRTADKWSLHLEGSRCDAQIMLRRFGTVLNSLNLGSARTALLVDDETAWPKNSEGLVLAGFDYDTISAESPLDAESRLGWLALQPRFDKSSYKHLADVYSQMGKEKEAVEVAMRRRDLEIANDTRGWASTLLPRLMGVLVGHGYKPFKILWPILATVAVGAAILGNAGPFHFPESPGMFLGRLYWSLAGSLDVFLPIDLGVNLERAAGHGSKIWTIYGPLHRLAGWILTPVFLAGVTGLIRKIEDA